MERRAFGELEGQVLAALWAADRPLVPAEVLDAVGGDLAYTTVMTILVRLHDKGLIERHKAGRAYAYRPVVAKTAPPSSRACSTASAPTTRPCSASCWRRRPGAGPAGTGARREHRGLRAVRGVDPARRPQPRPRPAPAAQRRGLGAVHRHAPRGRVHG